MHDNKQVITAPLGITHHKFSHNRIDFLNDVHSEQLFKFYLTRCDNRSDDFESCGVKFSVANLEVFE